MYLFDKKDTLNLFNAASSSLAGKDYNAAIKYFEELKKINYSGKGMVFYATNKKTKQEEQTTLRGGFFVCKSSISEGKQKSPRDGGDYF